MHALKTLYIPNTRDINKTYHVYALHGPVHQRIESKTSQWPHSVMNLGNVCNNSGILPDAPKFIP
jgi:hypothetical protein